MHFFFVLLHIIILKNKVRIQCIINVDDNRNNQTFTLEKSFYVCTEGACPAGSASLFNITVYLVYWLAEVVFVIEKLCFALRITVVHLQFQSWVALVTDNWMRMLFQLQYWVVYWAVPIVLCFLMYWIDLLVYWRLFLTKHKWQRKFKECGNRINSN